MLRKSEILASGDDSGALGNDVFEGYMYDREIEVEEEE